MNKIEATLKALSSVNAFDIVCYDTNLVNPFFNNVIIASVDSVRQLNASIEYLKDEFEKNNFKIKSFAGANTEWVVLDGCDILVHVFYREERARFDLDKLYMDCKTVDLKDFI